MKHSFTHRVIYQDTDAEGVVYYANYLGYFERGRMEMLRSLGFPIKELRDKYGIVFAIRRVECDYRSPALLEDEISIETEIAGHTAATVDFAQSAARGDKVLVSARIQACAIDIGKFRPVRIPDELLDRLKA